MITNLEKSAAIVQKLLAMIRSGRGTRKAKGHLGALMGRIGPTEGEATMAGNRAILDLARTPNVLRELRKTMAVPHIDVANRIKRINPSNAAAVRNLEAEIAGLPEGLTTRGATNINLPQELHPHAMAV